MKNKTAGGSFLYGAAILSAANLIVKIIGVFFRIPLANLAGREIMGYFNLAYTIYTLILLAATAGLPVALSKMVAESKAVSGNREAAKIFRIALILFTVIGIAGSVILAAGAGAIARIANNPNSAAAILAISPAVLFSCLMSACRGYFQGYSDMAPTAVSQVIEALCKLIFGYLFAWLLLRDGQPVWMAAAGAIAGVSIGTAVGAVYLFLVYALRKRKPATLQRIGDGERTGRIFSRLVRLAVPITASAAVISLTNAIDAMMIMNRLERAGFSESVANGLYGAYTGYSVTLFSFPPTFITALAVCIIPAVSAAGAIGDRAAVKRTVEKAFRITALISLPCAAGYFAIPGPLLSLLFNRTEDIAIAAPLLASLAPAIVFVAMATVTNALLQSLGHASAPMVSIAIGGAAKLAVSFLLVAMPGVNINGAPLGTMICYFLIAVINLILLDRLCGAVPNLLKIFLPTAAVSVAIGIAAKFSYNMLADVTGEKLAVLAAVALSAGLYAILIFALGIVKKADITSIKNTVRKSRSTPGTAARNNT